jgi:hypothetical protein
MAGKRVLAPRTGAPEHTHQRASVSLLQPNIRSRGILKKGSRRGEPRFRFPLRPLDWPVSLTRGPGRPGGEALSQKLNRSIVSKSKIARRPSISITSRISSATGLQARMRSNRLSGRSHSRYQSSHKFEGLAARMERSDIRGGLATCRRRRSRMTLRFIRATRRGEDTHHEAGRPSRAPPELKNQ